LLRALTALAETGLEFELDIVGVDTLGGEMQQLAHQLGLESRVRFHGFRTQRESRPMMEPADLLVMSSLHEAGPLVLLEAVVASVCLRSVPRSRILQSGRPRRPWPCPSRTGVHWRRPSIECLPMRNCGSEWLGQRSVARCWLTPIAPFRRSRLWIHSTRLSRHGEASMSHRMIHTPAGALHRAAMRRPA
jgi:hypothetical protein